jgi:penicillin-binding protein 2
VTVSPLQLAVAYAAMANGGTIYEPRVAKAIVSPTGKVVKRIKAPVRGHIPVSKSTLDYLRTAFYGVVNQSDGTAHGTYSGFPLHKIEVGGKTGTAELGTTNEDGSWFASFAGPADSKPEYVTIIEVDKADQGAISAAPFSVKMWDSIYGVQGAEAAFPDGKAPTKLPTLGTIGAKARAAKRAGSSSSAASPSSSPSSSSTATAALAATEETVSGRRGGVP